jgi:hypothetical protein
MTSFFLLLNNSTQSTLQFSISCILPVSYEDFINDVKELY